MKAFPTLLAASLLLLTGMFLAPAAPSAGLLVLGLVLGTVWVGTVRIALDRRPRSGHGDRVPVRIRSTDGRGAERDRRRR